MLFRLINTSATFQELINHVLYDYLNEFVITYLNNILIYFKNEENHKKHVKKVLKKLQEKKFYLKSKLIYFDYKKSAIINADASERAMRAQLQQINNEE